MGGKEIHVDVRIIVATSRDLRELIKNGYFRKELFYRLKVAEIHLPPLRERKEDIPLLVRHFLDIFRQEYQRSIVLVESYEKEYIPNALNLCNSDKEAAARLLGIDLSTLYRRLRNSSW